MTPVHLCGTGFQPLILHLNHGLEARATNTMDPIRLTLQAFQRLISERYEQADRARGTPKTFLWFIEEVGELATALNGDDRANLQEEFADVLAWLCTLANINDVDLAAAVAEKYLKDGAAEKPK